MLIILILITLIIIFLPIKVFVFLDPRPSTLILGSRPSAPWPSVPISSALGPKMEIIKMIFGNDIEKCLVDCESIKEFEQKLSQFYVYVSLDNDTRSFVQHFKKCKEDIIKYHVLKGAVRACELVKIMISFIEAINKLMEQFIEQLGRSNK